MDPRILAGMRVPQPLEAALTIMACSEGLILHRLTVDPDAAIRPVLERALSGCLADADRSLA